MISIHLITESYIMSTCSKLEEMGIQERKSLIPPVTPGILVNKYGTASKPPHPIPYLTIFPGSRYVHHFHDEFMQAHRCLPSPVLSLHISWPHNCALFSDSLASIIYIISDISFAVLSWSIVFIFTRPTPICSVNLFITYRVPIRICA